MFDLIYSKLTYRNLTSHYSINTYISNRIMHFPSVSGVSEEDRDFALVFPRKEVSFIQVCLDTNGFNRACVI